MRTSSATCTSCSWRRAASRWATRSWTAGVWLTTRLMVSGKYSTAPRPPLACQVAGSTVPTRRRTRRSSSVAGILLPGFGRAGRHLEAWMGTTRSATGYVHTVILSGGDPATAGAANTARQAAIRGGAENANGHPVSSGRPGVAARDQPAPPSIASRPEPDNTNLLAAARGRGAGVAGEGGVEASEIQARAFRSGARSRRVGSRRRRWASRKPGDGGARRAGRPCGRTGW